MNALSLDYINSKSPYLVKLADDGDFVFQTAKGVIYGIGFIENDPLPAIAVRLHEIDCSWDGLRNMQTQKDS